MLIGKRLYAYAAWVIHGRKTQLPPTIRPLRKGPPRKGPARDEAYKAWIRTLPCVGCGLNRRSEAAHTGRDGGMSMKASDYSCVPLCANCHTQSPGAYHRVGKREFERTHRINFGGLVAELNEEWRNRGA